MVVSKTPASLFPEARLEVEYGYDLVYRLGNRDDPKVRAFREWMADEVLARPGPAGSVEPG